MKICFLGDAGSVHIRRWVEYFRDKGHEVSIISFKNYKIEGVDVRFIGDNLKINEAGGNLSYIKKLFKIKSLIKEINPEVVNAHYLTSYGFIGALIKDRKLIVSTWGSDILVTPKRNVIYKKLTEYVIQKSDLITSDSNFMTEEIVKLKGKQSKILTVPMGIEDSKFNIEGRNNEKKDLSFLSMRTICSNSNIDIILGAFKRVVEKYPTSTLTITNSGDLQVQMKDLIKDYNIKENVTWLGMIPIEKVIKELKKCRYYISIPTSDSTSVTLLEAMASGSFPIVSDIPANKEWIVDEKNGYIVAGNNIEELESVMIKAIKNQNVVIESIEINNNIIKQRALWYNNMDKVENIIKEL